MARFTRKINMDPNEVKHMTLDQKKECMSEIDSRRELAWKFSLCFFFGSLIYIALYMLLSLGYMLSTEKMPDNLSIIIFIVPVFVIIPSFLAHSMDGRLVLWAVLAYMLSCFGLIVTMSIANAWLAPFAAAGAVLYIRMSGVCDTYAALSKEEGFPDFDDITALKDEAMVMLKRNEAKKEENSLNSLTETAILIAKAEQDKKDGEEKAKAAAEDKPEEKHTEITAGTEEKPSEKSDEKPETEDKPAEAKTDKPKAEEKPAEAKTEKPKAETKSTGNKPAQNGSGKKQPQGNKNGGRNKKSGGKKKHKKK